MHTPSDDTDDTDAMQTLATLCVYTDTENCIPALQAVKAITEKEAHLSRTTQAQAIWKFLWHFLLQSA